MLVLGDMARCSMVWMTKCDFEFVCFFRGATCDVSVGFVCVLVQWHLQLKRFGNQTFQGGVCRCNSTTYAPVC